MPRSVRAVLLTILIAVACAAPATAAERIAPPLTTEDYWAFADGLMQQLDSWWDGDRRAYILRGVPSVRVNSALLLTHAIAARTGHEGAARRDARARVLVDRLTSPPAWLGATGTGRLTTCWSKAVFDRGLLLFSRLAEANGGLPPPHMFGVHTRMEEYDCFCARMLANAARAVALDLGSKPSKDPPPLYAFDEDTGRLAVTTPRYSTAIVPDNRGVFPYGGIDPARLFGPGQTVAANVGGTPPAAFGVVIATPQGRERLASQHARSGRLRLVHAPRARPGMPRAGPFSVLEARGTIARGGLRIRASHRFRAATIESRWRVRCAGRCRYRVWAHFPTWGAASVIDAERHDGTRVPLAPGTRIRLADVSTLHVGRGYRVVPLSRPRGATLVAVRVARQPTNPNPGPSLRVELVRRGRFHERSLAVRIEPTRG